MKNGSLQWKMGVEKQDDDDDDLPAGSVQTVKRRSIARTLIIRRMSYRDPPT